MKKKMISCLMDKAYEMGYELTKEDVWTFERECLNVCAIRAGGMDKVDEYLEEHGLAKAYCDYENDADNLYYKEFIEIRMDLNPAYNNTGIESDPEYYVMSEEDRIDMYEREYYEATHSDDDAYTKACKIAGFPLSDDEYMDFCEAYELQMAYATCDEPLDVIFDEQD